MSIKKSLDNIQYYIENKNGVFTAGTLQIGQVLGTKFPVEEFTDETLWRARAAELGIVIEEYA
tara:strand:+ start:301 stop:489 length:189 start_codon:yes stop_codon:yes gene_type:complete